MDFLFYLELIFTFSAFFCGILILKRNIKYIGNLFFGIGYICYAIPALLLLLSRIFPTRTLILLSVKSMVAGGAVGIGLLYLGTLIFFKGKFELQKRKIIFILCVSIFIVTFAYGYPDSVKIVTEEPVNSQLNLALGAIILVWHLILASISIIHLINVRKSAIEEGDKPCCHKINYIIAGFIFSIIALVVYSVGNFGETSITDILFFSFSTIDIVCIFRGLIRV